MVGLLTPTEIKPVQTPLDEKRVRTTEIREETRYFPGGGGGRGKKKAAKKATRKRRKTRKTAKRKTKKGAGKG